MENNAIAQVAQNEIANPVAVVASPQMQVRHKSKRAPKPILWTVLSKSKRVFAMQIHKTNKLKLECVNTYVGSDAHDIERFWLYYRDQVELLLDSKRFERECLVKGMQPEVVAEHIVFEGAATVKRVIKYGLNVLGSGVELFRDEFTNGKLKTGVITADDEIESPVIDERSEVAEPAA